MTHNAGTSGLPLPQFSAQAAVSVLRLPLQNGIGIPAGNNSLERLGIPEGLHGIQTTSPQASMTLHGQTKLKTGHGKKTKGRVKIKMEFIENKLRRYTTFSKRKAGLMKKVRTCGEDPKLPGGYLSVIFDRVCFFRTKESHKYSNTNKKTITTSVDFIFQQNLPCILIPRNLSCGN